jgi:hypothetical protein
LLIFPAANERSTPEDIDQSRRREGNSEEGFSKHHRKKSFSIFPYPAAMSLTKLSLGRKSFFYGAHCKKQVIDFPVPSRDVTYQTLTKLVSDIPAGDGKIDNLFLQCMRKEERQIPRQIRKEKKILLRWIIGFYANYFLLMNGRI